MERKSGVLMHISSLFGDYSIGGFSEHAKTFVDFLSDCGFTYWQVLPFCMVDDCNSPYQSYSTFAGNPYFIDLESLQKEGLLTNEELSAYRQQTPYSCEYARLYHTRNDALLLAANRVKNRAEIVSFIEENPYLEQFCRFMALKDKNEQKCWSLWTEHTPDADRVFLWQFIQFTFFRQWAEIKAYANKKGIKIIGDLPFYVSYDSADVWGNQSLFQLDEKNCPKRVAGVPPDYFSEDGQLWGNPLYDWDEMEKDGFTWWHDRLAHAFKLFDGVRIDHFRAFEAYWSVDAKEETARNGKWVKGPDRKMIDLINEVRGDKLVIAEDLGEVTPGLIELVKYSGFPGMKVFQFGFLDMSDSPHKPHNYENNCVAYTGTHDNNTLLGYVWEISEDLRKEMLSYCGYDDPNWDKGYDSILRTLFASSAGLVILPIQDLLGYGSDTRLNIPGKADGNWQFRITKEQLDSIDKAKFSLLNKRYSR